MCWCVCCDSTKLWAWDLCQATVSPRTSSAWMLVWGRRSKAALVSLVRVHNLQHLIWRLLVTVRVQNNNRQHLLSTYIVLIGMNIFIQQYVLVPEYGAIHYLNLSYFFIMRGMTGFQRNCQSSAFLTRCHSICF